jgi:hypothetical protein
MRGLTPDAFVSDASGPADIDPRSYYSDRRRLADAPSLTELMPWLIFYGKRMAKLD